MKLVKCSNKGCEHRVNVPDKFDETLISVTKTSYVDWTGITRQETVNKAYCSFDCAAANGIYLLGVT